MKRIRKLFAILLALGMALVYVPAPGESPKYHVRTTTPTGNESGLDANLTVTYNGTNVIEGSITIYENQVYVYTGGKWVHDPSRDFKDGDEVNAIKKDQHYVEISITPAITATYENGTPQTLYTDSWKPEDTLQVYVGSITYRWEDDKTGINASTTGTGSGGTEGGPAGTAYLYVQGSNVNIGPNSSPTENDTKAEGIKATATAESGGAAKTDVQAGLVNINAFGAGDHAIGTGVTADAKATTGGSADTDVKVGDIDVIGSSANEIDTTGIQATSGIDSTDGSQATTDVVVRGNMKVTATNDNGQPINRQESTAMGIIAESKGPDNATESAGADTLHTSVTVNGSATVELAGPGTATGVDADAKNGGNVQVTIGQDLAAGTESAGTAEHPLYAKGNVTGIDADADTYGSVTVSVGKDLAVTASGDGDTTGIDANAINGGEVTATVGGSLTATVDDIGEDHAKGVNAVAQNGGTVTVTIGENVTASGGEGYRENTDGMNTIADTGGTVTVKAGGSVSATTGNATAMGIQATTNSFGKNDLTAGEVIAISDGQLAVGVDTVTQGVAGENTNSSRATVTLTGVSKKDDQGNEWIQAVTAETAKDSASASGIDAIARETNATNTITAENGRVSVSSTGANGKAYGIESTVSGGTNNITVGDINADAGGDAYGVNTRSESTTKIGTHDIHTGNITVDAGNDAYGIYVGSDNKSTVSSGNIQVSGTNSANGINVNLDNAKDSSQITIDGGIEAESEKGMAAGIETTVKNGAKSVVTISGTEKTDDDGNDRLQAIDVKAEGTDQSAYGVNAHADGEGSVNTIIAIQDANDPASPLGQITVESKDKTNNTAYGIWEESSNKGSNNYIGGDVTVTSEKKSIILGIKAYANTGGSNAAHVGDVTVSGDIVKGINAFADNGGINNISSGNITAEGDEATGVLAEAKENNSQTSICVQGNIQANATIRDGTGLEVKSIDGGKASAEVQGDVSADSKAGEAYGLINTNSDVIIEGTLSGKTSAVKISSNYTNMDNTHITVWAAAENESGNIVYDADNNLAFAQTIEQDINYIVKVADAWKQQLSGKVATFDAMGTTATSGTVTFDKGGENERTYQTAKEGETVTVDTNDLSLGAGNFVDGLYYYSDNDDAEYHSEAITDHSNGIFTLTMGKFTDTLGRVLRGAMQIGLMTHHEHDMVFHAAVAENCTTDGNSAWYFCNNCLNYYSDAEGTNQISKDSWIIAAKGHSLKPTAAAAETCTTDGNSAWWYCDDCKNYFSDKDGNTVIQKDSWIIPAKGHSLKPTAAVAETCTTAGNSAYWTCETCGKFFSDKDGKTEIQENAWIIPAAGHNLEETAAVAETCTTAGNSAYWTCKTCGKFFSDKDGKTEIQENAWIIPATGHSLKKTAAVAPTCTADGNSVYWTCGNCGKFFGDKDGKEEIEKGSWVIPATGHSLKETAAVAPTCITGGSSTYWTCETCGKFFSDKDGKTEIQKDAWLLPPAGHSLKETAAVAPTCTAGGNSAYWTCETCGKFFSDKDGKNEIEKDAWLLPANGHTPGEPKKENEKAAGIGIAGSYETVVYCTVCGQELSRKKIMTDPLPEPEPEAPVVIRLLQIRDLTEKAEIIFYSNGTYTATYEDGASEKGRFLVREGVLVLVNNEDPETEMAVILNPESGKYELSFRPSGNPDTAYAFELEEKDVNTLVRNRP